MIHKLIILSFCFIISGCTSVVFESFGGGMLGSLFGGPGRQIIEKITGIKIDKIFSDDEKPNPETENKDEPSN